MADYTFALQSIHDGIVMPCAEAESIEKIRNLEGVEGDILLGSYPKTGTTWMNELLCAVAAEGATEQLLKHEQGQRTLYLEFTPPGHKSGVERLETANRPAIMKSHLQAGFLNKVINNNKVKIVLVVRNPKDTLVSLYHFYKANEFLGKFPGTFDDFFELYKAKRLIYGDFFDWCESWMPHLDKPNVLLVTYEEMKQDIQGVINRLSTFLGKKIAQDKLSSVIDHTSFDNMKSNKKVNMEGVIELLIRKGQVGGWQEHFSPEQSRYIDEEYETRLKNKGIELLFEI